MQKESELATVFVWIAILIAALYTMSQIGKMLASFLLSQLQY